MLKVCAYSRRYTEESLVDITKEIVTVAEMARMLSLSRARFYELKRQGVFPEPTRRPTGRPVYTRAQQESCLQVRRTHRGINGQPVLFYAVGPRAEAGGKHPQRPKQATAKPRRTAEAQVIPTSVLADVQHGLGQLGVEIENERLRTAIGHLYPAGVANVDQSALLMSVFDHLNRRDSQDNVAG